MTTQPTQGAPATAAGAPAIPEDPDMGEALLAGIRTGQMWLHLLMALAGALTGAALWALVRHLSGGDRD